MSNRLKLERFSERFTINVQEVLSIFTWRDKTLGHTIQQKGKKLRGLDDNLDAKQQYLRPDIAESDPIISNWIRIYFEINNLQRNFLPCKMSVVFLYDYHCSLFFYSL